MKRTFLKRILPMFLLLTIIFSCFACDINNGGDKTKITLEVKTFSDIVRYENFEELNNFVMNEQKLNNQYFFVINTENFPFVEEYGSYYPPSYSFNTNGEKDGGFIDSTIRTDNDYIYDKDAPQTFEKKCGCMPKIGTSPVTCKYLYYAYPTSETTTPITFKHCLIDAGRYSRAILLYQEEKLIGSFFYYVKKPNDAYYEKFLKDHLMIIGVSAWSNVKNIY